jgi:hypothetical protein
MTYAIYSENGQELSQINALYLEARRAAVAYANYTGETVYLDTVPSGTDEDNDEDCGEAIAPSRARG